MKSLLKVMMLGSLMVVSRLDKQNWQLTAKPVKESIPSVYPLNENDFSKAMNNPLQQLYISQR